MLAAMAQVAPASAAAAGARAFDTVPVPADAARRSICLLSGMPANRWCPRQALESVPLDSAAPPCSWHHNADEGLLTVWPAEYRAWAKERGLLDVTASPVVRTGATAAATPVTMARKRVVPMRGGTLVITNPPPGAIYLVEPTLRREFQTLPLRASGASGELAWMIDGRAVGTASAESPLHWPLIVGRHIVAVEDPQGRRAETTVLVK